MAGQNETTTGRRALSAFDDRYGDGAFAQLSEWLAQPCVTFAQIANHFDVSRERVRQWHRQFLPNAPTGHERRRRCALQRRRRQVFGDGLFRMFFQQARAHVGPGRIQPISSRAGYRRSEVLIDGRVVALRDVSGRAATGRALLFRYRGRAEFLFVRLSSTDFVLLPTNMVADPAEYRNSFAALDCIARELDHAPERTVQLKALPRGRNIPRVDLTG